MLREFRTEFAEFIDGHEARCQCGETSRYIAARLQENGYDALAVGLDLRNYPEFYGAPDWSPIDHCVVKIDTGHTPYVYLVDFTATQFRKSAALPLIWREPRGGSFPECTGQDDYQNPGDFPDPVDY